MSTEENKAHIQRFMDEVLNRGDLAACDELVAPDFIELDPLPGQEQGREGLKQALAQIRQGFPDIHWSIEAQIAEADMVATRFVWRGTHRGEFFGVPATGRQVSVPGVVIDRIVGGKMNESRILMDTLGMMQQLGVIPTPGQPGG